MRIQWLIVGGGIHGVHIAARLLGETEVKAEDIRIVDPGKALLERWRKCTETSGMTHLRSPSVHHLDLNPWALERFAGKRKSRKRGLFAFPYERPALSLFNNHCDQVIQHFGLNELHIQARALTCSIHCDGVRVKLSDDNEIETQNVVLAIGASEQPQWPQWAPKDNPRIHHVFASDFDAWPSSKENIIVVGGGISAGQVALRLVGEGHKVHLVSRHKLRQHQFDSDPGWLGPKFMGGFKRERNIERRRAMITQARHQGSVPPDIYRSLLRSITSGHLHWYEDQVESFNGNAEGVELALKQGVVLKAQRVLLATGFTSVRPGGTLVDQLIASESLACAQCGYPIVDEALRWHPRVYVSGPLAELELGPVSRNIAGSRRAGQRIVDALLAKDRSTTVPAA